MWPAAGVVACSAIFWKKAASASLPDWQVPHLVSGRDRDFAARLLRTSGSVQTDCVAMHTVVSGTSQRMAVHRPEQDGRSALPRLVDREKEGLNAGDFQRKLSSFARGTDIVTPPLERLIRPEQAPAPARRSGQVYTACLHSPGLSRRRVSLHRNRPGGRRKRSYCRTPDARAESIMRRLFHLNSMAYLVSREFY